MVLHAVRRGAANVASCVYWLFLGPPIEDVGIVVSRFNYFYGAIETRASLRTYYMKKTFTCIAFALGLASGQTKALAQTTTNIVKAGTVVNLQAIQTVKARDVEVGDDVKFRVTNNVVSKGEVVIPAGVIATGIVSEAKKSSLAGTKGKLSIDIKNLLLDDGTIVPLTGIVRVTGKNRTPLAVITGIFLWPCIFIPGTKAVLTEGYDARATVVANTEVPSGK